MEIDAGGAGTNPVNTTCPVFQWWRDTSADQRMGYSSCVMEGVRHACSNDRQRRRSCGSAI